VVVQQVHFKEIVALNIRMDKAEPMKKIVTVVVILLVVVSGVVLGVMQPWKKDGNAQEPEGKSTPKQLASSKEPGGDGTTRLLKTPKKPSVETKKKPATRAIPTRVPLRAVSTKKTEKPADKNSTVQAQPKSKANVLVDKHDPPTDPEKALLGSWMTSYDGFEFTIILNKEGKGEMRIAEGDRKATPHMITWKADAKKLTLVNKNPKTHDEDVTEGQYKLSDENGIKSLQLKYELEEQDFTFINVKY